MSELIRSGEFLNQIASDGESTLYPGRLKILIGSATCGIAAGARDVEEAALRAVKELGLDASISRTGCIGYCRNEPILDLMIPGSPRIGYGIMTPDKTRALLESYASSGDVKPDLAIYRYDQEIHTESGETHQYPASTNGVGSIPEISTIDFFRKQERVILRNCGSIDPMRIDEAVARGAYRGAFSAIAHKSPKEVIEEMKASGLRGRGGAGFLTGMKWDIASQSESDTKYIVCNGEEGDPGAFMDRCVLESDPHAVLEGMIVAAYAVGACEGFLYIRSEYRQAVATVEHAIREAEKTGLLGDDIFGSSFSFRIKVRQAAGAYVCGEETTLIASLEGHSGEPSIRPPYPVTEGMWKKPTVINNVKTLASIGPILSRGAEWYSSIGVENNRGTTVFSLVGAVKNTGLVEIPLGIPMREIVEEIGGGLPGKLPFKAIQRGMPSRIDARSSGRISKTERSRNDDGIGFYDRHRRGNLHPGFR